jgi:hypothetical protein
MDFIEDCVTKATAFVQMKRIDTGDVMQLLDSAAAA